MRFAPGHSYAISYTSDSGDATGRTIDVIDVYRSRAGVTYLRAYCHLRGDERTFREDRVDSAEEVSPSFAPSPRPRRAPRARRLRFPAAPAAFAAAPARAACRPAPAAPFRTDPPASFFPSAGDPAPRRETGAGRPFRPGILNGALGLLIGLFLITWAASGKSGGSAPRFTPPPFRAAVPYRPPVPPPPAPKPAPSASGSTIVNEARIGGYRFLTVLRGGLTAYEVPALRLGTRSKTEAVAAIRIPQFVSRAGFSDRALMDRYLEADRDGSGKLSFDELEEFQKTIRRDFRYSENETALRPDRFLREGGGDCEDFALYTAGLLRFWGWDPYIASFGPASGNGHAVCFSYEAGDFPAGYTYYRLEGVSAYGGTPLRAGNYVPIDYQYVGDLSDAVEKRWKLRAVYVPENIWGMRM